MKLTEAIEKIGKMIETARGKASEKAWDHEVVEAQKEWLRRSQDCEYEELDVGKLWDDWEALESKAMDRAEKQVLAGVTYE